MEVNRALINSKFEGYRLDPIPQEKCVARYKLQYVATQATVSGRSPLSFQEVQSRITHNHLTVTKDGSRSLYIDANGKVILVAINGDLQPLYHVLYELPIPVPSQDTHTYQYEYPSAAFLTPSIVFVSDGHGSLYMLEFIDGHATKLTGAYTLPTPPDAPPLPIPFRIHEAALSSSSAIIVLSSRHHTVHTKSDIKPAKQRTAHAQFDIWAASFSFPITGDPNQLRPMEILWRRRGDEVPIYVTHDADRNAVLLLGSSLYREIDEPPHPSYTPTPDEIAPIPRPNENLDAERQFPEKPPPYSWTQTPDSVTVAFPLPSSTPKSHIKVLFSPRTLTLHVEANDVTPLPLPHYSAKALWDSISPSSSFWTWDREGERAYGILTLHLDKQQEGLKWMHVFAASAQPGGEDVDVPETLDPSELWAIREALEKYTSALKNGEDASGLGLGKGMPSLAEGEMDDEVDSSVGRTAVVTWVADDGSNPPWFSGTLQAPFTVLCTPLPGAPGSSVPSIIIKNHVDGTVFTLSSSNPSSWEHTSTFSALAFVLASKQDTRFTHHVPSKAVFAFENGSSNRGGNVYIYRSAPLQDKWAKQAVLKVSEGIAGSLLGTAAMQVGSSTVLVCLTDGELVIISGVI